MHAACADASPSRTCIRAAAASAAAVVAIHLMARVAAVGELERELRDGFAVSRLREPIHAPGTGERRSVNRIQSGSVIGARRPFSQRSPGASTASTHRRARWRRSRPPANGVHHQPLIEDRDSPGCPMTASRQILGVDLCTAKIRLAL